MPRLGHTDKGALEERREGLRVETPASADRQIVLPGRTSDPSGPDLPAGDKCREYGDFAPLEGVWRELREMMLRPEGETALLVHSMGNNNTLGIRPDNKGSHKRIANTRCRREGERGRVGVGGV